MKIGNARASLAFAAAFWLAATGLSCSPFYVSRAAFEEAKILWRRRPIDALLAHGNLSADQRKKLEIVLAARRFAANRIGLDVGGSYTSLSEVDDGAMVHLVTAARRDRLEPYTWWFPIVGRMPYKGFFSKEGALALAESLEGRGYDTYVRPALAFSTLGWFDDPLPSTLLARGRVTLANTLFHELFHSTLFVVGEVDFNESAATFVGNRGAIEFFCAEPHSASEDCGTATDEWHDVLVMSGFIALAYAELEDFYASAPGDEEMENGRQRIFSSIRERFDALEFRTSRYHFFPKNSLNNATLLHDRIYLRDLDLFDEVYRHYGSLARVVAGMLRRVKKADEPFRAMRELLADPPLDVAGEARNLVRVSARKMYPLPF